MHKIYFFVLASSYFRLFLYNYTEFSTIDHISNFVSIVYWLFKFIKQFLCFLFLFLCASSVLEALNFRKICFDELHIFFINTSLGITKFRFIKWLANWSVILFWKNVIFTQKVIYCLLFCYENPLLLFGLCARLKYLLMGHKMKKICLICFNWGNLCRYHCVTDCRSCSMNSGVELLAIQTSIHLFFRKILFFRKNTVQHPINRPDIIKIYILSPLFFEYCFKWHRATNISSGMFK